MIKLPRATAGLASSLIASQAIAIYPNVSEALEADRALEIDTSASGGATAG
jgi:hypothetical protein